MIDSIWCRFGHIALGAAALGLGATSVCYALDLTPVDAVELGVGLLGVGVGLLLLVSALGGEEDGR